MNPFCVPFATTNMGSAMLAIDLVGQNNARFYFFVQLVASIILDYLLQSPYKSFPWTVGLDGSKLFDFYCLCN